MSTLASRLFLRLVAAFALFAFAGDIVGFGFLPEHIHCAQTLGETRVRCLPLNALGDLLANDAQTLRRYDAAVRREFEFRRNQVIGLYWKPASRLAAFFLALSQINKYEGRDPCLISEAVKSGNGLFLQSQRIGTESIGARRAARKA